MTDSMCLYAVDKLTRDAKFAKQLEADGQRVPDHVVEMLKSNRSLGRNNRGYQVKRLGTEGYSYLVEDYQAATRVRHMVNVDLTSPSCSPCQHWSRFLTPCVHMLLVLSMDENKDLWREEGGRRASDQFYESYFHPSYLVANIVRGYSRISIDLPTTVHGMPAASELV